MTIEQALQTRIEQLITQGQELRAANPSGYTKSNEHYEKCQGWMTATTHIVELASGVVPNRYTESALCLDLGELGNAIPQIVGRVTELLIHMLTDMRAGLLASIGDHVRAETFDNFLDHGQAYLDDARVKEAGVIVGVVFEDSMRRICRKHEITEKDVNLDNLISAFVKKGVLKEAKAKRARVAAHVRTKATHAQWDEFTASDVTAALASTRELIENQLDT